MALPLTGPIKFSNINVELGLTPTLPISLGSLVVRSLYGVPSGPIRLWADGKGKSSAFAFTISSNVVDANLRTLAVAAGWNQTSAVVATVATGVIIYSSNTTIPALTINGSWPNGITLTNNGSITGRGGNGGNGTISTGGGGTAGGPAVSLGVNVVIANNGIIGGGGGGGGAGGSWIGNSGISYGGGGGGGGMVNSPGGARGSGNPPQLYSGSPGTAGSLATFGTGGAGSSGVGGNGGNGGFLGASGSAGVASGQFSGGTRFNGGAGGAAGKAVNLNGFTVTWTATGTRYGAIS